MENNFGKIKVKGKNVPVYSVDFSKKPPEIQNDKKLFFSFRQKNESCGCFVHSDEIKDGNGIIFESYSKIDKRNYQKLSKIFQKSTLWVLVFVYKNIRKYFVINKNTGKIQKIFDK